MRTGAAVGGPGARRRWGRVASEVIAASALVLPVGLATAGPGAPAAPAPAVAPAGCRAGGLVIWLPGPPSGAAGSVSRDLELTNLSGRACRLAGYPGVSAVDLAGRQLGRAADREPGGRPAAIVLASGRSAVATVQIVDVRNDPRATCRPTMAAGLRVYPPDDTRAKVVPLPLLACRATRPVLLSVGTVRKAP